jgi:RNA polymerase sigma-70 factor (ECF subfamily)
VSPVTPLQPDLTAALRRGDHGAFEAIFRTYYEGLVRFASRLVDSQAEAEELVQDVMLKVWEKREQLDAGDDLKAYLFRATRNHALNLIRRRKLEHEHQQSMPPGEPAVAPEESDDSAKTEQDMLAAIDALPDKCREIFLMSRQDGLSYRAIAEALDLSVKTVETQMGRALKALRTALSRSQQG